jgi:tetratricopeptide (TPR) repeat protein
VTVALPALLAIVAYFPSLAGVFQFDDFNVIVGEAGVHSWRALLAHPGIRPLLKASYVLNWTLDHGPLGFHALNMLVHALNAALVYEVGRRACARWMKNPEPAALAAAALFALHPAQTEAVTYICGRSSSLMAAFYLASLLLALEKRALASAALFAAALLVKETAVTLPFALLLLGARPARAHWLVLGGAALGLCVHAGYRDVVTFGFSERGVFANLRAQADGVWYLVARLVTLRGFNIDPALPVPGAWDALLLVKALGAAALLGCGFARRARRPWLGFAILWFFLQLAPTNSLVPRLDVANDRQLYLACLGPLLALCVEAVRFSEKKAGFALGVLAVVFGAASVARQLDYTSEIRLWESSVRAQPRNPRAFNNLGTAYEEAGRLDEAREAYAQAVRQRPDYQRARVNLRLLDWERRKR